MSAVNSQNPMSSAAPAKSAKKVVKAPVAAPAAPAPAVAAPAAAPAAKKAKAAAPAPAAAAPAPAAPAVTAQTVAPTTENEVSPVDQLTREFEEIRTQLTSIRDAATTALSTLKVTHRRALLAIKAASKGKRRARREATEGGERKPSIFQVPVPISNELAAFLNVPRQGSAHAELSRSEVTKRVMAYVTQNKLNNKHEINPNAALKKLLAVADGDNLSIFKLQTYLRRHYIKPTPAATA